MDTQDTRSRNELLEEIARLQDRVVDLRRADEESRRLAMELKKSETRYRNLVEHSLGLICTHDLEGRLLSINHAVAQSLEYKPGELIGMSIQSLLASRVQDFFPDYLRRLRRQGVDQGIMHVISKSGEELVWAYRNVLIETKESVYVLGHAQDITSLERARRELRRARRELKDQVSRRTAELSETNRRLRREIQERKAIEASLRDSQRRLELLNEIALGVTAEMTRDQVIDRTVQWTSRFFPDVRVFFSEVAADDTLTDLRSAAEGAGRVCDRMPAEQIRSRTQYLERLRGGDALIIDDLMRLDAVPSGTAVDPDRVIRALLLVPVQAQGTFLGMVGFVSSSPRHWTDHEVTALREVAGYISTTFRRV